MTDYEFKIEKGIAAPPPGIPRRYPFAQMEVGESFAVDVARRQAAATAAHKYGNANSKKFTIQKHGDAFRCWRIS